MFSKIIQFIPCLIAYNEGRSQVHHVGSPYLYGSPEDTAWRRGYDSTAELRNV